MSDDLSLKIWKKEESFSSTQESTNTWSKKEYKWICILTQDNIHSRTIFSVSWSKWNGLIATSSADKSIKIHRFVQTFDYISVSNINEYYKLEELHVFDNAHDGFDVNCVAWCKIESDAHLLASCGDDELVRIWSLNC